MARKTYCLILGLLICGVFWGTCEPAAAAQTAGNDSSAGLSAKSGAQQLEKSAEALYGYVLEGDVAKVRQESEKISRIFVTSSFEGITSVEGVNALSGVIIDLKAALAGAQISEERWESAAAKLRLAANSLNHTRQPMWIQYYKLIREDLSAMERSAQASDLEGWKVALERLQSRYDNIRPAILISRKPEVVNAFDTWISYAAGVPSSSRRMERERLLEIVSYGQEAARVMFGKEKDEPALSYPIAPQEYGGWALLAGGFILSALIYAAYRKYRGESKEWKPVQ